MEERREKKNKMEDASRMNAPLLEEEVHFLHFLQLLRPYLLFINRHDDYYLSSCVCT